MTENAREESKVKCVVWDLDNTLWNGVLLENDKVSLRGNIKKIMAELDRRGILQSIASKNEYHLAMDKLKAFEIDQYFLYPQINWNPKSMSIQNIAKSINIGMDTLAFIDDQPFEREEVQFSFPQVLCIDAVKLDNILDMPEMNPRFITEDSKKRRQMYLADIQRNEIEEDFSGTQEDFLASLNMTFSISRAKEEDLKRAEELTVRTNQLNTTGYTYSYDELNQFRQSDEHLLLVASLDDKYGTYGKIGLSLIECHPDAWIIKLLLMSCRVMSRGVGTILINYIRKEAKKKGVCLKSEMIPNDRNRMMYVTYKFANFKEVGKNNGLVIFENDLSDIPNFPESVDLKIEA